MITNTHSVGVVRDAVIAYRVKQGTAGPLRLLVVAAGRRRDLGRLPERHQRLPRQAGARLRGAGRGRSGRVRRGERRRRDGHDLLRVQGRDRHVFAAARSSRQGGYTVGVLVQANHGLRDATADRGRPGRAGDHATVPDPASRRKPGSIIIVVATDAPLLPHQFKRLARRVPLGHGPHRAASPATARATSSSPSRRPTPRPARRPGTLNVEMLPNERMYPLFEATVQATEEAIVNALVAAETMKGIDGNTVHAIPHERLREILKKYNPAEGSRLNQSDPTQPSTFLQPFPGAASPAEGW